MYLVVFLIQPSSKIFFTEFIGTDAGKILKILVCDKIAFQFALSA